MLTHLKTAGTLSILVYFLSQNPTVLRRLRDEILTDIGPVHSPTVGQMKGMKYLRAVLNGEREFAG